MSNRVFTDEENKIILEYLDKQIKYSEQKAEELRKQINLYPEDKLFGTRFTKRFISAQCAVGNETHNRV